MDYNVYSATKPNGDPTFLAILPDCIAGELMEDFFFPGTTNISKCGAITISGDAHLCPGLLFT